MASKQDFRRCVVPCPRYITGGDTHQLCDSSVRVPRGAGPAAAEAQRRLSSWGSHMDLVAGFETGPALSQPLPAGSGVSAQEGARAAASPSQVEAPMLRLSSSEELDVVDMGDYECSPAHTPADEELLEVLSRAVAKLNIEWPADDFEVDSRKSLLDERFLPSRSRPPRRELPFFPNLHTEVSRSWNKPASFRVYNPQTNNYSKVQGIDHHSYMTMPRAEETLASYLSPESASSLKAPTLPTKPLKNTSLLVGKAYSASGQAAACLHTMAILQAYQADLLRDMDNCEEVSADAIRELRRTTDLSLRATKETAKSGHRAAFMVKSD
ncbi:uncharacterized protein si:ch211-79h18.2 [Rhinichthys klamathensis goyatoka]|uniref:uncharacterized protein si:ch211-79h18.2 n=1 Tax=Rhinichthys klamathensis goyatoka TaxID=3034132 RepID=UPI0024B484E9|nr:uncharacterized protein si:ch211-79h18.2 [Rhinichthys klamathensis goyatoka]